MTKIYEGGGVYTISFGCSGKTIELTEDEMNEIVLQSEEYKEYKEIKKAIEEQLIDLGQLEDLLFEMDKFSSSLKRKKQKDEFLEIREKIVNLDELLNDIAEFI